MKCCPADEYAERCDRERREAVAILAAAEAERERMKVRLAKLEAVAEAAQTFCDPCNEEESDENFDALKKALAELEDK